jgi:tetratricopeptide (TPR) repeat protein
LFIAYIIHNLFIFDTSANFIAFFSVAGFVSFLSLRDKQLVSPKHRKAGGFARVLTFAGIIVAIVFAYSFNVVPAKANYATTRAILLGWANDFPGAIAKFKESVAYDVPGKYEYRNRLAQFILEYTNNSKPITPDVKEAILFTVDEVKKNITKDGQDYLPHLYASRLYVTLGKDDPGSTYNDMALEQAQSALDISPNFVRTQYEFAQVYLNRKDYVRAIEYFKKAVDLNPHVGVSYWYWGFTENERGNYVESARIVEQALNNGYAPSKNDFGFLVELYSRLNDSPKLVRTYEGLVKVEPKNAQFFASLAAAYVRVNRIDDALNAARKAVTIDPSFIKEAQAFARSLGREF